ncbi:hypothetical protein EJ05DRAFT_500490 [Pseudovirgaria hyperparasitica]|uniref:Uncharacterized protein n=1 Tax=Pseudovirgaria hyperparasitica TaxID=470096 RepID=A0A6A6W5Z8_9PEZI|nr:uncharacterized protein EJ05DRAFT_500490 [Pseudovirgaria hyperparasitica]KAF2757975.1 hypothetical protein EJ05DRAFT_500490 [Pseudovirgaria hyperparasitica]
MENTGSGTTALSATLKRSTLTAGMARLASQSPRVANNPEPFHPPRHDSLTCLSHLNPHLQQFPSASPVSSF